VSPVNASCNPEIGLQTPWDCLVFFEPFCIKTKSKAKKKNRLITQQSKLIFFYVLPSFVAITCVVYGKIDSIYKSNGTIISYRYACPVSARIPVPTAY